MGSRGQRLTRRRFVGAAGGLALGTGVAACTGDAPRRRDEPRVTGAPRPPAESQVQRFRSRPDLRPAEVVVTTDSPRTSGGLLFLDSHSGVGQQGPLILDEHGGLVWFKPLSAGATPEQRAFTVRAQRYRGEPVVTWFEGRVTSGHGKGEYVVADSAYREITRVRAAGGRVGDLHEFLITEQDTALFLCYDTAEGDLETGHGTRRILYFYGVVQEIDIATGELLFEWRSDEHVPLADSYKALPRGSTPYDYIHLNSIAVDADGHLVVSARNTWAVYKIDRGSGDVRWRMGGKSSDFELAERAVFAWQHHAVPHGDGRMTIFDNQAAPANAEQSRGLVLDVDEQARTATHVAEYTHPGEPILAGALGSFQLLPDGHRLIGFGQPAVFTEYAEDGTPVFDARLAGAATKAYRVYKAGWVGEPAGDPAIHVRSEGPDALVDVSWNGATEVARWRVLGGRRADELAPVGSAGKAGFETAIRVTAAPRHLAVEALDRSGAVLGRSQVRAR